MLPQKTPKFRKTMLEYWYWGWWHGYRHRQRHRYPPKHHESGSARSEFGIWNSIFFVFVYYFFLESFILFVEALRSTSLNWATVNLEKPLGRGCGPFITVRLKWAVFSQPEPLCGQFLAIFGKFWQNFIRFRLYRQGSLQVNTKYAFLAFVEIYKSVY